MLCDDLTVPRTVTVRRNAENCARLVEVAGGASEGGTHGAETGGRSGDSEPVEVLALLPVGDLGVETLPLASLECGDVVGDIAAE